MHLMVKLGMSEQDKIKSLFIASITAKQTALESMCDDIAAAIELLIASVKKGNKILSCGNGGSAADAQHFSSELINRFHHDRVSVPAIALTTDSSTITSIANDYDFNEIFARQISSLGHKEDILLAISTSGNSKNILRAIEEAHLRGMHVIAFTGRDGGEMAKHLNKSDVELRVPSNSTARTQEVHLLLIHILCARMDNRIFDLDE